MKIKNERVLAKWQQLLVFALILVLPVLAFVVAVGNHVARVDVFSENTNQSNSPYALQIDDEMGRAMKELVANSRYSQTRTTTQSQKADRDILVNNILHSNISNTEKNKLLEPFGIYQLGNVGVDKSDSVSNEPLEKTSTYANAKKDGVVEPETYTEQKISLGGPDVRFDSQKDEWIISANGYFSAAPTISLFWPPKVGSVHDVGGLDTVGIFLKNAYGNTNGMAAISGSATISGDGGTRTKNTRIGDLDTNDGVAFNLQDAVYITESNFFRFKYKNAFPSISIEVRYSSHFVNFRGNIVLGYAHTWDDVQVNSIGVGLTEITVSWTNNKGGRWFVASWDVSRP